MMNRCEFEHMKPGDKITWRLTGTTCFHCSKPQPVMIVRFTYRGHVTVERVYDVFERDIPEACPDCGVVWTGWAKPCNADGSWLIDELERAAVQS